MEGTQLIAAEAESAPPVPMLGHVTSSYFSPNLGRSIAMALVTNGRSRIGDRLWASRRNGAPIAVTVTDTDFLAAREKSEWLTLPLRRSPLQHRAPIEGVGGAIRIAEQPFLGKFVLRVDAGEGADVLLGAVGLSLPHRAADERERRRHVAPLARAGRMDAGDCARGGRAARRGGARRARRQASPARRGRRLLHS